jgi:hypothetical protein
LAGRENELKKGIKQGELISTAHNLRELMGERTFQTVLKERFYRPEIRTSENHRLLPTIPFAAILTTDYDKLVEAAYTVKSECQAPPTYTQNDTPALANVLREKRFYVLKVHGDQPDRFRCVDLALTQSAPFAGPTSSQPDKLD